MQAAQPPAGAAAARVRPGRRAAVGLSRAAFVAAPPMPMAAVDEKATKATTATTTTIATTTRRLPRSTGGGARFARPLRRATSRRPRGGPTFGGVVCVAAAGDGATAGVDASAGSGGDGAAGAPAGAAGAGAAGTSAAAAGTSAAAGEPATGDGAEGDGELAEDTYGGGGGDGAGSDDAATTQRSQTSGSRGADPGGTRHQSGREWAYGSARGGSAVGGSRFGIMSRRNARGATANARPRRADGHNQQRTHHHQQDGPPREIGSDLTSKVLGMLWDAKGACEGRAVVGVDQDAGNLAEDDFENAASSPSSSVARSRGEREHGTAHAAARQNARSSWAIVGDETAEDEEERDVHFDSTGAQTRKATHNRKERIADSTAARSTRRGDRRRYPLASSSSRGDMKERRKEDGGGGGTPAEFVDAEIVDDEQKSVWTEGSEGDDDFDEEDAEILQVDDSIDDGFFSRYRSSKKGTLESSSAADLTIDDGLSMLNVVEPSIGTDATGAKFAGDDTVTEELAGSEDPTQEGPFSATSIVGRILNVLNSGSGPQLKSGSSSSAPASTGTDDFRRRVGSNDHDQRAEGVKPVSDGRLPQDTALRQRSDTTQETPRGNTRNASPASNSAENRTEVTYSRCADDSESTTRQTRDSSRNGKDAQWEDSFDIHARNEGKVWLNDTQHRRGIFRRAMEQAKDNSKAGENGRSFSKFVDVARKGGGEKVTTASWQNKSATSRLNDYGTRAPIYNREEDMPSESRNSGRGLRTTESTDDSRDNIWDEGPSYKQSSRPWIDTERAGPSAGAQDAEISASRLLRTERNQNRTKKRNAKQVEAEDDAFSEAEKEPAAQLEVADPDVYDENKDMPWAPRDDYSGFISQNDNASTSDERRARIASGTRQHPGISRRVLHPPKEWDPLTSDDIMRLESDSTPFPRGFAELDTLSVKDCTTCRGSGLRDCPICEGEGWIDRPPADPAEYIKLPYNLRAIWELPDLVIDDDGCAQCPPCNGIGKAFCSVCEGSGSRTRKGFDLREGDAVFGLFPQDDDEEIDGEEDLWKEDEEENEDESDDNMGLVEDAENGEDDSFSNDEDELDYGVYEGGTGDLDLLDLRYRDPDEDDEDDDPDEEIDEVTKLVAVGARAPASMDDSIVDPDEDLMDVRNLDVEDELDVDEDDDDENPLPFIGGADVVDEDGTEADDFEDELD